MEDNGGKRNGLSKTTKTSIELSGSGAKDNNKKRSLNEPTQKRNFLSSFDSYGEADDVSFMHMINLLS